MAIRKNPLMKPRDINEFINGVSEESLTPAPALVAKPEPAPNPNPAPPPTVTLVTTPKTISEPSKTSKKSVKSVEELLSTQKTKTFPLDIPPTLHPHLVEAAKKYKSMHEFILTAIAEKIIRDGQ